MTILSLQAHSETLISNAIIEFTPKKVVLSFNGGKDCTVLLDLVAKVISRFPEYSDCKIKTVYVREKNPFTELESFINSILNRYKFLEVYSYNLDLKDSFIKFSRDLGLKNYAMLVGIRKTDPFCSIQSFKAFLTFLYVDNLAEVHASDNSWPQFTRIHPLLNWKYKDIWNYVDKFDVGYCELYKTGYTSLGSKERTFPNPMLLNDDGTYEHARVLQDCKFERLGRK